MVVFSDQNQKLNDMLIYYDTLRLSLNYYRTELVPFNSKFCKIRVLCDYYHNLQVRHPLSCIIDKRGDEFTSCCTTTKAR